MAFQGKPKEVVLLLTDATTQVGKDDVDFSDVVVKMRKPMAEGFVTKTIEASNWVNLGLGFYAFQFSAADNNALGTFVYTVAALGCNGIYQSYDIEPEPFYLKPAPGRCIVHGTIMDIGGQPASKYLIKFRPVSVPSIHGSVLLQSDSISTYPDAGGNFSVELIRDLKVVVECEPVGLKVQIRIPDQETAELSSLLPPIPPALT